MTGRGTLIKYSRELKRLQELNSQYQQALEFYADIRNYHSELWENTAIEDDCGRIARQTLEDTND